MHHLIIDFFFNFGEQNIRLTQLCLCSKYLNTLNLDYLQYLHNTYFVIACTCMYVCTKVVPLVP